MGLSRQRLLPVKQWLKMRFKHTESSSSVNSCASEKHNDEEDLSTIDDTVFLYDDRTGDVSYNWSPIEEETKTKSGTFGQQHNPLQLPLSQPPSLSVMLAQLERDLPPSTSIITEILISMSSSDLQRDRSTPVFFATDVRAHDADVDSVMHLLSNDDESEEYDEEKDDSEKMKMFGDWMRNRSDDDLCRQFEDLSPRLSGKDFSDPVRVYQARDDFLVCQAQVDFFEEHCRDLKHRNKSYQKVQDDTLITDDCTFSSADTALVSNKTSSTSQDWNVKVKRRNVRQKVSPRRRSRWIGALRNRRYSSSLPDVMEEDE